MGSDRIDGGDGSDRTGDGGDGQLKRVINSASRSSMDEVLEAWRAPLKTATKNVADAVSHISIPAIKTINFSRESSEKSLKVKFTEAIEQSQWINSYK